MTDRMVEERNQLLHEVPVWTSDRRELFRLLGEAGVRLNGYATQLLHHPAFALPPVGVFFAIERSVGELGCENGACLSEIFRQAQTLGYRLCPPGLGPFARLAYANQPESGAPITGQHRAPAGAMTIASPPLVAGDAFPKGFYLRTIGGENWLRGYVCDEAHIWAKEDVFLFLRPSHRGNGQN